MEPKTPIPREKDYQAVPAKVGRLWHASAKADGFDVLTCGLRIMSANITQLRNPILSSTLPKESCQDRLGGIGTLQRSARPYGGSMPISPSFVLPGSRTALQPCRRARKKRIFTPVRESNPANPV
jgi:hypothetical protein